MIENSLISLFYRVWAKDVLAETGGKLSRNAGGEKKGREEMEPVIQKICILSDHILRYNKRLVYNSPVLVLAHLSDVRLNGKHEVVSSGQRVLPPQR